MSDLRVNNGSLSLLSSHRGEYDSRKQLLKKNSNHSKTINERWYLTKNNDELLLKDGYSTEEEEHEIVYKNQGEKFIRIPPSQMLN